MKCIDAAGVGGEGGAVRRGQRRVGVFGDAAHAQPARFAVGLQRRGPTTSARSAGEAAQGVHLPQAVLRGDVALREEGVLLAAGADVRLAQSVEGYRGAAARGARSMVPERCGSGRQAYQ